MVEQVIYVFIGLPQRSLSYESCKCSRISTNVQERTRRRHPRSRTVLGTVERYAVQTGELDTGMDRQFEVLMLTSFRITGDTINALKLKLYIMVQTEMR